MFDILFLGTLFPRDEEAEIVKNSKQNIQNAANLLQWDYVEGLDSILEEGLSILTKMAVGTYPHRFRKPLIRTHRFHHKPDSEDISVGFINIPPIRQVVYPYIVNPFLAKWAADDNGKRKILIAYSYLHTSSIVTLKKHFPQVKCVLILPDLPCYTNMAHQGIPYELKRKNATRSLNRALNYVDGIVPITEAMRKKIDPEDRIKSVVVEGMIKDRGFTRSDKKDELFRIVYAGTLSEIYGIMDLANAVSAMQDDNLRLIICGGGQAADKIKSLAEKDQRIDYRGVVSAEEAFRIQTEADILVNPRKNDNEYTKYSFPSKILQYMSTGRPVLCFKLDGIPNEYDDFLIYMDQYDTISSSIHQMKSLPSEVLSSIGRNAQSFVLREKTSKVQAEKILNLVKII